ncbi:MAG: RhuM family protein [Bacillota bacterium]
MEMYRASDVNVAKNYLNQNELDRLNRIVTMYIDYAVYAQSKYYDVKDWLHITD